MAESCQKKEGARFRHRGLERRSGLPAESGVELSELVEEAWTYFNDVTVAERQWASLIPEGTPPPIHLNAEKMERFRPMLEPLRYDPSRYATYLEQLGIEYPTIKRDQER